MQKNYAKIGICNSTIKKESEWEEMKKHLVCIIAIVMSIMLCACGKSEAAQNVDNMIEAIGEVTIESEAQIVEAERAAEALTEEDSKQLDHLEKLTSARKTYNKLVIEAEAAEIDKTISEISTVTLESKDVIDNARKIYNECSDEVKSAVTKLAELEAAEERWNVLSIEKVEALIDSIGEVTIDDEELIAEAHESFNALSDENAAKVKNAAVLAAADSALEEVKAALAAEKAEQAQKLLSQMNLSEDKVRGLKFYYSKVHPYYADIRCYVLPYIGQDDSRAWLCAEYHYTDDDWVFFKKITFAVDGKRYYKSFDYFDVSRDNDGGEVWEYVNTANVTDSDIEMFWAIADSTETIVRFEGDDHYYDFIVGAKDKQAIRDILTAYEALQ